MTRRQLPRSGETVRKLLSKKRATIPTTWLLLIADQSDSKGDTYEDCMLAQAGTVCHHDASSSN